jgi:uncharacterized DUF497 family protein
MIYFYWTTKNAEHIAEHGVTIGEAEYVVLNPARGYPLVQADAKLLVRGQTPQGQYIQVIYVMLDDATEVDFRDVDLFALELATDAIFVVHARPLTDAERAAIRKRKDK